MVRFDRCCLVASLAFAAAMSGCANPPGKEMNQAQGAIDAARAAGADRFAAEEFTAAVAALERSDAAVTAGDYRQALSHALDSRERAQHAAKMAVEGRANARGAAERTTAEVATLLARAQSRLQSPDIARTPGRALAGPRAAVDAAAEVLQKARAALQAEDYDGVTTALDGVALKLQEALTVIDAAASSAKPRRGR